MEKAIVHSKAKLGLAIITSPRAAFEEILERNLLSFGLWIVAATGLAAMTCGIVTAIATGPMQWFALGKENPLTWVGLCMLYAFALHRLLKWMTAETEFVAVLTILSWAHVILLVHQVAGVISASLAMCGSSPDLAMRILQALKLALPLYYLIVVGIGLGTAYSLPARRGVMAYFVIATAAVMAFDISYAHVRTQPFIGSLPGIAATVSRLTPAVSEPWMPGADQIPRLAAGLIGLLIGAWYIGAARGSDVSERKTRVRAMGAAAVVILGGYVYVTYRVDYYGRLLSGQQLYELDRYAASARKLEGLLPAINNNAALELQIGDLYYLAGQDARSMRFYVGFLDMVRKAGGDANKQPRARGHVGVGTVRYAQNDYKDAITQFKKAAEDWPDFREPWVRMALAYDQMGQYDKAVEAANHAIKKLDSEAPAAWVALTEAFAQKGDVKQAKAAYEVLVGKRPGLAKKIGASLNDWKTAADKLTRSDLQFPLEKQFAKPPPKPTRKRAPARK